ncbi:helix-turn-helix domain-containing protein [Pedobacter antarcticus]|uniref:helix-turn-helix domain-containing protein n=1 Tax=Pedobacter antarcticus TaxID=34086 RepID=UPI001C56D074|nr:AraC family transcriptional regulator [Pedobacter antarcticus]
MKEDKTNRLIHKSEQLEDFETLRLQSDPDSKQHKPFRFFNSADCLSGNPILYRRRDFFKVSLLKGEYIVHYGDESIKAFGCSLSFFSPWVPYTITQLKEEENAGYMIFTELYYNTYFNQTIRQSPLFDNESKPIFLLDEHQEKEVKAIFSKIERQEQSDYPFKDDLIRNHLNELIHYANMLQPATERHHALSSKERLHSIFHELLDRQFPVDIRRHKPLRTASDFAETLNVHVNYLNRVLKEMTGKSTSEILYERLLRESIILLKHTNWSISEIAYSLGFKDLSHFNHFFRRQANVTPSYFRN